MSEITPGSPLDQAGSIRIAARLLREHASGQWRHVVVGLVPLLAGSAIALLQPWPLKLVLDSVLGSHAPPAFLTSFCAALGRGVDLTGHPRLCLLLLLCGAVVVLQVLSGVCDVLSNYFLGQAGLHMVFRLRCAVFDHLQRLSLAFHDTTPVGDSLYRVAWDTYSIQSLFSTALIPTLTAGLTLTGILAVMLTRDWLLTLIAISVALPLIALIRGMDRPMTRYALTVHERESGVTSRAQETLSSIRTVQAFGREPLESGRFREQAAASRKANLALTTLQSVSQAVVGLVLALGTAAVVWVAATRVLAGRLTPGDVVLLTAYVAMLHRPLDALAYASGAMQSAAAGARRVLAVLDARPHVADSEESATLPGRAAGHLALEDVSFRYPGAPPALTRVSLDIAPGESIALVGASGAGKTTLASLVLRFYDPDSGSIKLDGRDLRLVTLESLRRNIALVLQEPVLFGASISENIAYGRPDTNREEIEAAARAAGIHDFITTLPLGYETILGERGVNLSGGQRQRISIARAFLKDASVLILDEPTSSLDAETENVLLESLKPLIKNRTTIIIAHRLSTVRHVDRVVVLDGGRIVETGKHQELLDRNGLYARLHRLQLGQPEGTRVPGP
jgi:ATP-binding cassette subfamily B protein